MGFFTLAGPQWIAIQDGFPINKKVNYTVSEPINILYFFNS